MKIAFVTPWYGPGIPGGAEAETRRTIAHLQQAGYAVDVLTTCIKDFFAPWDRNYYKPGNDVVDNVPVRRFRVETRDSAAFNSVNWQLMQGRQVTPAEEEIYISEMIKSPGLYEFIHENCSNYLYFFIPYMFATTYFGAQVCPERSVIIPCLHDEAYAYMSIYQDVLPRVNTLVLHTQAERRLADRIFGHSKTQQRQIVGEGVDTDFEYDAERFRQKYGIKEPFVLYAGRRDAGKNVPLLLQYWERYVNERPSALKLVLVGPGEVSLPPRLLATTIDLGFIPAQDKYDAFAAAEIFCLPSINESFSIVTMEAWLTETPVLVHRNCDVTREHCQMSNGGLYFSNYPEFAATVDYLRDHPDMARQMGQNGRSYVLQNYRWPTIMEKYGLLIDQIRADIEQKPSRINA